MGFVGPEGRQAPRSVAPESEASLYIEEDTGLSVLLENLSCAVVNRIAGAHPIDQLRDSPIQGRVRKSLNADE